MNAKAQKGRLRSRGVLIAAAVPLTFPGTAAAHSFGKLYTLPVPVSLYVFGSAAALLLSFLVVGFFVNARSAELNLRHRDISDIGLIRCLTHPQTIAVGRLVSVAGLALTMATGFFGSNNAYRNFSMTFFWIIFVLGYHYLTALLGNSYAVLNPWQVLCDWLARLRPTLFTGRIAYPRWLSFWPALLLYMAFVSFELFGGAKPFSTATALCVYTGFNLTAAFIFGSKAWFYYGEFFAVLLRTIGAMSPFTAQYRDGQRTVILRQPMIGLSTERVGQFSLLMFILFMLSSTAFDGIKSTVPYVSIYWVHVAELLTPWVGEDIVQSFPTLKAMYFWWQLGVLALSPFLYLAIYWLFIWLTKRVSRCDLSVSELAYRFAYSLVPIAFVYNVTHYYGLLLTQGTRIVTLISDPFGLGWDLFGTANTQWSIMQQPDTVWHSQVFLILAGHIISVYLAHLEALKIFGDRKQAALSQLPMLVLMVVLTSLGLWILSLPISTR